VQERATSRPISQLPATSIEKRIVNAERLYSFLLGIHLIETLRLFRVETSIILQIRRLVQFEDETIRKIRKIISREYIIAYRLSAEVLCFILNYL
jgi:hypothetical protein